MYPNPLILVDSDEFVDLYRVKLLQKEARPCGELALELKSPYVGALGKFQYGHGPKFWHVVT
jgi:hypothetical protein